MSFESEGIKKEYVFAKTDNGKIHPLILTEDEKRSLVELDLTNITNIVGIGGPISVEMVSSVATLLGYKTGESFPLDVDEEFLEKIKDIRVKTFKKVLMDIDGDFLNKLFEDTEVENDIEQ